MNAQETENLLPTGEITGSKNSEKPSTSNPPQRTRFLEIFKDKILPIIFFVPSAIFVVLAAFFYLLSYPIILCAEKCPWKRGKEAFLDIVGNLSGLTALLMPIALIVLLIGYLVNYFQKNT